MDMMTCLACDGDESVLVCKHEECGFAVHEKCLPCLAYFDASGSFYCPECAYDLVVKERVQAKKRDSLAKQAMLKFGNDLRSSSNVQISEFGDTGKQASLNLEGDGCGDVEVGGVYEKANAVMDSPDKLLETDVVNDHCAGDDCLGIEMRKADNGVEGEVCEKENSVADLSNKLAERDIVNECSTADGCLGQKKTKASNDVSCDGMEELQQVFDKSQIPVSSGVMIEEYCDADMRDVNELPNISRKKHTNEEEGKEKSELFVENSDISESDDGANINKKPIVKGKRVRKERGAKCAHQSSSVSDIKNGEADESVIQEKDIATSSLKRKSSNTDNLGESAEPFKTSRKQWSEKEVEILKEGVEKFSIPNTQMPWNRILQFGSRVFEPYRTAVDLKDKWRNLTK